MSERPRAQDRRWQILAVVLLAQLVVVLGMTVVTIALPAAQIDLGFSESGRQWVITAYLLAFGSLLLFGGRLSDLIGRKRSFVVGLIGFALAFAAGGAADSFGELIAARAVQGLFGAILAPAALAMLTTTFTEPSERARAFGWFGAVSGAGAGVGLLLGGLLTGGLGWRWSFYVNAVFAVVAFIGAVVFFPPSRRRSARLRLDIRGSALVSLALFGVVLGFSRAGTDGWSSPWFWGTLTAAAVLLTTFGYWQSRAVDPLLPLSILRDRNRAASFITVFIVGLGLFGIVLFVTALLQNALHYSPVEAGLAFLPMTAGLVAGAQVGTNVLLPRWGAKVVVPLGLTAAAAGMAYMTHIGPASGYLNDILAPLILVGLGIGMSMPGAMQSATLGVDHAFAGVASATVNASQQIGGSIGAALFTTIAAHTTAAYVKDDTGWSHGVGAAVHGYDSVYWWCAALFAAGALVAALLFRRKHHGLTLARPSTPKSDSVRLDAANRSSAHRAQT